LHLHRLEHHDRLAGAHGVAVLHDDVDDRPDHRRAHGHLAVHRPHLARPAGVRPRSGGYVRAEKEGASMPQNQWSPKRERQYEHIKSGLKRRGESEDTAEEIAARTVNKERARRGEARRTSRTSVKDISSGRRGGLRSRSGPGGRTYRQLY